jgi:Lrp/AsnC family leucine-responsive transcriptional regulator
MDKCFSFESHMAKDHSHPKIDLDEVDRRLVVKLMREGRATWADLAVELGLTAPAIAQRVRRLEERGVIRQFAAWVDPKVVAPVTAYVGIAYERPDRDRFSRVVEGLEAVQECSRVSGPDDYLLKVRCGSLEELDELVGVTLPKITGVTRVETTVVLSTVKDTPVLPVRASA